MNPDLREIVIQLAGIVARLHALAGNDPRIRKIADELSTAEKDLKSAIDNPWLGE